VKHGEIIVSTIVILYEEIVEWKLIILFYLNLVEVIDRICHVGHDYFVAAYLRSHCLQKLSDKHV
jgi:hypothetical protein